MSTAGLSANNLFTYDPQGGQSKSQLFTQEFQQLGKDLQSGNLSAAQSDFATLTQLAPPSNSPITPVQGSCPIAQDFQLLAQDLQAGNVSAAQQDYTTIRQDLQSQQSVVQERGTHHHHSEGPSALSQLFSQLGQSLQAGDLAAAQQAYSALQQDFQSAPNLTSTQTGSNGVSLQA
jgi:hypothetical protein